MPQEFISNFPVYASNKCRNRRAKEETIFVTKGVNIKEIERLLFEWKVVNSASIIQLYRALDFTTSRNNRQILPDQAVRKLKTHIHTLDI